MSDRDPPAPDTDPDRGEPVLNVREEMNRRRGALGRAIDTIGQVLRAPGALLGLLAFHVVWVLGNVVRIPGVPWWDPPPFPLLATITSCLAPFFSMLILMTQHRNARINELRAEIALQVALRADRQLTFVLTALAEPLARRASGDEADEVDGLKESIDPEDFLERVQARLDEVEGKTEGQRDE